MIEDRAMMQIRVMDHWAFKEIPEEIVLPMLDMHRKRIYYTGLLRLLRRLIRGADFKIVDRWENGHIRSFQHTCERLDAAGSESMARRYYRFVPAHVSEYPSADKAYSRAYPLSPFERINPRIERYGKYIARDFFRATISEVGLCGDGCLFINQPCFGWELKDGNLASSFASQEKSARELQDIILSKLISEGEFILYPYGSSLQSLLSLLVSRNDKTYSSFVLRR